jgi:hypothetical protein
MFDEATFRGSGSAPRQREAARIIGAGSGPGNLEMPDFRGEVAAGSKRSDV